MTGTNCPTEESELKPKPPRHQSLTSHGQLTGADHVADPLVGIFPTTLGVDIAAAGPAPGQKNINVHVDFHGNPAPQARLLHSVLGELNEMGMRVGHLVAVF